jgi:hypothetical protein
MVMIHAVRVTMFQFLFRGRTQANDLHVEM